MKQRRPHCPPVYPCEPPCRPVHPDGCGCPDCRAHGKPCDEQRCGCDRCADHAHRPPCPQRILMPKILGSGRCFLRCTSVTICLEELPACHQPPLMLTAVCAACDPPPWVMEASGRPNRRCLHVTVPLDCEVRDACGTSFRASASIEADVPVTVAVPDCECWRARVVIQPCVRLVCPTAASDCGSFSAQLDVLIEAWLVRWEPFACSTECDKR